jgi:hypothetical protein
MSTPAKPILQMTREEIDALQANEARMKSLSNLNRMKLEKRIADLNRGTAGLSKSAATAVSSSTVTPSLRAAFGKTLQPVPKLGENTRKFYEEHGGKRKRTRRARKTRRSRRS